MNELLVECPVETDVSVTGPLDHLCPFVDEIDHGTVTIEWTTAGSTLELHALRAYLDGFRDVRISHEELASAILLDLDLPEITNVAVTLRFETAGFAAVVRRDDVG